MRLLKWLMEKYVYLFVLLLFILVGLVIVLLEAGSMDIETAKVYLQALTAMATLALLYFAYFNVSAKREQEIANLELAVRPVFIWEVESSDGGARLSYKTLKHPIYDLRVTLQLDGEVRKIEERHLDVSDSNPNAERKVEVSPFILTGLHGGKSGLLRIGFAYHSEVGGRYEFSFTKEVLKKPHGFVFQHRKIISAKYPWRSDVVKFED